MKRMIQLATVACFTLICGVCFIGCSDDAIVETSSVEETYQPFRLTASQETPSRLAIGEDGLSVTWEPGDQLVLVKKDRSIVPIYMNTELDEPSTSATFVSETGVPAGDYWVIYNYNDNLAYSHHGFSSIDEINSSDKLVLWGELTINEGDTDATIALQHLYAKVRVELQNLPSSQASYQIGMYASKTGFPVYQQLTQNGIINVDYCYDYNTYNYAYKATNRRYHNMRLGYYYIGSYWSEELNQEITTNKTEQEKNSALFLPADVSSGTVYFYVLDGNDCYEIPKSNLKFEPGKSYKVVLDMNEATKNTLTPTTIVLPGDTYTSTVYQLASVEDCRHAAYRGSTYGRYMLVDDVDFTGDTYLPITAKYIWGNKKTLKNVSVEWSEEDYVGLVKYDYDMDYGAVSFNSIDVRRNMCTFTDLILENVQIKGRNYVGALSGTNVMVDGCKLTGASSVVATENYVGGLVGCNNLGTIEERELSISNSYIEGDCKIEGDNYVGGIVGICDKLGYGLNLYSSLRILNSCSSAAMVTATGDYAGGIFGSIGSVNSWDGNNINFSSDDYTFSIYGCVNTGVVKGKDYVGGIGGNFALYCWDTSKKEKVVILQSANEGDIEGANYVGGIVGAYLSSINLCYSIGDYSATGTNLGGIVGGYYGGGNSLNLTNCYSMANLTIGAGGYEGGIFGSMSTYMGALNIENCYFAGSSSTNSGIIGHNGGVTNISNCLTTLSSLGDINPPFMDIDGDGVSEVVTNIINSLVDVTSILENKRVINGDNAYSDTTWPNYNYECVKFAAGLSGSVVAPGFGTEIVY